MRFIAPGAATLAICAQACLAQIPITVFFYDRAGAPADLLEKAKTEAEWLLGNGGVQLAWHDCSRTARCFQQLGPTDVVLTLLKQRPKKASRGALGYSVSGARGFAAYSWVFMDRVQEQAWESSVSSPVLLGCAMAHELGHLFLGSQHAASGLMRGKWGSTELSRMNQRLLRFTPEEQAVLRNAMSERLAALRGDSLSAGVRLPFGIAGLP